MGSTRIEWATDVWNPVTGCSRVSEGCRNCYAERMAKRLAGRYGYPADEPFRVTVHPERLDEPLKWRKPRRVFVCSMGDLFHEDVPFDFILRVMIAIRASDSFFMVLTKRPERMRIFFNEWVSGAFTLAVPFQAFGPLPNLAIGVSVEDQKTADERIPILLDTTGCVTRFVSYEPALGPVDFDDWLLPDIPEPDVDEFGRYIYPPSTRPGLDWVIAGGETGPGARPAHPDWFRSVRDQCFHAGVKFFFKQWGEYEWIYHPYKEAKLRRVGRNKAGRLLDGRTWDEFPEVLQ